MERECLERFEKIDRRLESGDDVMKEHSTDIAVIKTNMDNLTRSLSNLTKALWGVCATTGATLLGFFIWYVQNI